MPRETYRQTRRRCAPLAALLFLAAPAWADAGGNGLVATLPFELGPRGHVLVPVTVNGSDTATFAVDTGASTHVINARYVAEMSDSLPAGEAVVVSGAHAESGATMTVIEHLDLGPLAVREAPALVMDLSHVEGPDMRLDGLLGTPFLSDYDVLIDFDAAVISLYEAGSLARLGRDAPHAVAPIDLNGGHGSTLLVGVVLGAQPLTAVLDTGSGRSAINARAAAALGIELPPGLADTHGDTTPHTPRAAVPGMEIGFGEGGRLVSTAPVAIIDLPVFASLGLDDEPAMLLGTNFLEGRRIGIDYAAARLYLFE